MNDRRCQPRRSLDLILNAYQDGVPRLVAADNISCSGMRIRRVLGPQHLTSKRIDLEFQLPKQNEVLYVQGECVYEKDGGGEFGVRFTALSRDLMGKLKAFINPRTVPAAA